MRAILNVCVLLATLLLMNSLLPAAENLAVPGQVQFAGRIEGLNLTAEGAEATEVAAGVRGVTFSLFAEQSGGAALWVESQNVAVSGDGAYNTLLGAETAGGIPQSIFASGEARWLEVSYTGADGATVTQPRVLLVSVPYALKAGDAATLGGLPASAFVLNTDAVASRVSDNGGLAATSDSTPGARVSDLLPSAAVTAGSIAKFNSALATDVVDSIITEASGKIGIGTTTPVGTIDVGGWPAIPNDIQGVGSTISGDVFMGNTNGGIGRFRMASNALQGFFSWNQYYNGTNHKGMDGTAPGWRVNIGGTGAEDAYYVERSPATAGGHVPARLFVVNGNGRVGINTGTAAPLGTLDVGGWPAIPNDIQGVGTTISGDVFMGNTNGGIGRYRMASNALQGFFSWNQYYNGVGHKGMDATAPGWRINVGGTGIEDAFYVERSPATANLHAPERLFQVSGSGNVGIGTTAPTAKFHVVGNTVTTGTATVGGFTMNVGSSLAGKVLTSDASGVGTWQTPTGGGATLGANTFTGDQTINANAAVASNLTVGNNFTVDTTTLAVDALNNRVGIGINAPTQALDVNGSVRVRAGGALIVDSGASISCTNCINSSQLDDSTDLSDGGDITGDITVNGTVDINSAGGSPAGKIPGASMTNAGPTRASVPGVNLKINGATMVGTGGVFGFSQNPDSPNVVIGNGGNIVDPGVFGASILGGGAVGTYATVATAPNRVSDIFGVVGGGTSNLAGDVAGTTLDRGWAFVGGGSSNIASGQGAAVVGGSGNWAKVSYTFIGGGQSNTAGGVFPFGTYAVVGGGKQNTASGDNSTVIGGFTNLASNSGATVLGGYNNAANGYLSTAAGYRAKANHDWSFVWSDGQNADFGSTAINQFRIRALGGLNLMDGDLYLGAITPAFGSGGNTYFENSGGDSKNTFRVDGLFNNLYIAANSASGASTGAGIVFRTATAGQGASESDTMVIKPDGTIGMGTNTPVSRLSVQGLDKWIWSAGNGWGDFNVGNGTVGLAVGVALGGGGLGDVRVWPKGGTQRLTFGDPTNGDTMTMASGRIGIGTLAPAEKLHVVGNIRVTGCVGDNSTVLAGTCVSDARYKQNVKPLPATLAQIAALRPVSFDWRTAEFPEKNFSDQTAFGLIAQEVEQTLPGMVGTDDAGWKAVNYGQLPLLAIQAVRELKQENDELKARLARLESLIEERLGTQVSKAVTSGK